MSLIVSYHHLVWATAKRAPTLTHAVEPLILDSFARTCEALGLRLIAANGAWNHVHLLIAWSPDVTFADAVRGLKTQAIHDYKQARVRDPTLPAPPRWQRGYAIFSLRQEGVPVVARYVRRQKLHHQCPDSLIPELERCAEDDDAP